MRNIEIDNVLGAGDRLTKIELTLNAELLHLLSTHGARNYCPTELIKTAVKLVGYCENLEPTLKEKFKEINRN